MEIVFITFEPDLSLEEIEARFRERAQHFRDMDGLLQKFYVHDEASGQTPVFFEYPSRPRRMRRDVC